MKTQRQQFSRDFKYEIGRQLSEGRSLTEIAPELKVHPNTLIKWQRLYDQYGDTKSIIIIRWKNPYESVRVKIPGSEVDAYKRGAVWEKWFCIILLGLAILAIIALKLHH